MQDMPHQHDVCLGQVILKKIAGYEHDPVRDTSRHGILLKDRFNFRTVESQAAQVRVRKRDLHSEVSLGGTYIDEGLVPLPWKRARDKRIGRVADAGHGSKKLAQACSIGIKSLEEICFAILAFVLRLTGTKSLSQVVPDRVEASVCHLKDAANV